VSGTVVWITGLPRAGKSRFAARARTLLRERGRAVLILDGDAVRAALAPSPGYDAAARDAFYRTLGHLAALAAAQDLIVLVPATAHERRWRDAARAEAPRFVEVFIDTPLELCRARDPAGLYRGEAQTQLPGAGLPYQPPVSPDIVAHGGDDAGALAMLAAALTSSG
jgi:adenylylsulfate kinase